MPVLRLQIFCEVQVALLLINILAFAPGLLSNKLLIAEKAGSAYMGSIVLSVLFYHLCTLDKGPKSSWAAATFGFHS